MKKAILIILLLAPKAFCAELLVPGQFPTIQSAIDAANPGDTVVVAPGTYTGPGDEDFDFHGKAITVRSIDPNDQSVVNDTIINGETPALTNVRFQSGETELSVLGGLTFIRKGIYCYQSSPTIRNCNFAGVGIRCEGTNPASPSIKIINCRITDNIIESSAPFSGGAVSLRGANAMIIGCDIRRNRADAGTGAGIYCDNSNNSRGVMIIDCNICDNSALIGGGIYQNSGWPFLVDNCRIENNRAVISGGIFTLRPGMNIKRSLIRGNVAQSRGGGIYAQNSVVDINNTIVAGNFSQTSGGGIYIHSNSRVIANWCSIGGNAAGGTGGGIYFESQSWLSALCSIFWGNSDSSGTGLGSQITPTYHITSMLFSCIQDADSYIVPPFDINDNRIICDDPLFVRMPNDGGDGWGVGDNDDYGDLHLLPDSPCIDAGNSLYVPGPNVTDIDGQPRVIGRALDMGADEYGKMIIVNSPVDGEVWATNSRHRIKWFKYGVGSVDVLLSTDDGVNWQTIAGAITDNNYLWQIPGDIESNQCVIAVLPSDGDANVISWESGLFTVSWYPVQSAVPPEWEGFLPAPDLSENQGPRLGCVKWVFETAGPVSSQIAVTWPYWNSYSVYIGCEDGLVYALDDEGQLLWSRDINTPIVGSPAVGFYEMVYVAGQNGWLYAIDDDGDLRWTHTTDAPVYSTPVVDYDGRIYVCSEDGLIYALDDDGSVLWTFQTKGPANLNGAILATPGIDSDGSVYIAGLYDPNLYALNAVYGSVKWVCTFASAGDPNNTNGGLLFAPPAVGPNGTIYQTLVNDSNLYAINPDTGNIIWVTLLQQPPDTNSSGWSPPVVGQDGTIYVCVDVPYLWAVNPDGSIKWVTWLGMVGGFTLSVDRDGFIYAASDDGYVCVVDSNGQEVSRFKGNDWVSFPAIAEDGTLIVSDANNRVWAITDTPCEGQPPVLRWPMDVQPSLFVDFTDFAIMADSWLQCSDPDNASCDETVTSYGVYFPGDVSRNYYVNYEDIALLADEWLMEAEL